MPPILITSRVARSERSGVIRGYNSRSALHPQAIPSRPLQGVPHTPRI